MHNAELAFLEGQDAQQRAHKDDYTRLLPIYISTNKTTASSGKSNYDRAIEKCEKAIKVHSIKKKPTYAAGHRLTAKEKEFRQRKEFNPYLHRSWLMLGQSQFLQGNFFEAASTFSYMTRLYATQPDILALARVWLARCYVALEWPYDAEDILHKMRRDSLSTEGQKERDNTMAAFLVQTQRYEEAVPYLQATARNAKGKLQRARLHFLLAQLYHETGKNDLAYKTLSKVIRANPPYELEFNARIMQTEVMPKSKHKQMIKKLQRMAKSDRNKDYLDRVYYAIGNIYLSVNDTTRCCYAWEKGIEESTNGGVAKAVLCLRLGELYWECQKYIEAQKAYQQCVSLLDKEHEDYKESERRSKILDELAPPLADIKLQDSLQVLAQLPEKERMAAIDRVIDELKKKEKEAEKKAAREGDRMANNNRNAANRPANNNATTGPVRKGAWYFYNPQTVQNGMQAFRRQWGNRKNEDNWRRQSKERQDNGSGFEEYNYDDEPTDSLGMEGMEGEWSEEEQARKDSLANDPHEREYYLRQIPFTEEDLEASNQLICDGLYKAGIIETERLENFPLALNTLQRLLTSFPDFEKKADVYYHMFLLMGRMGNNEEAEHYRQLLIEEYPEDRTAVLLANPNYQLIAREGSHIEDSVYMATYRAYQEDRYTEVNDNFKFSTENFPEGKHRAKLLFVHAMTQLYTGHQKTFVDELKELVQKYSSDEIAEMAQYIVKGLEEGRLLSTDKFSASDIWSRRTVGLTTDSLATDTLSDERFTDYSFVLAYPAGSLDEDQLLYEMARYNFTSYMVRNFEIELLQLSGINMMAIKGFQSYDEVHAYAQQLYSDRHMATRLEGIRSLLISDKNLQMLGKQYSFEDYGIFFDRHLAPLNIPDNLRIDDQTDIPFVDPEDVDPNQPAGEEEEELIEEDDFPFGF
ncbi:MAG: tetratricopeptide repeat protein [Bacteroidales bacterium]|nr:tetratricopeptide repeat protein [Candidatus Physcousia equi]